jgi:UDP-N-acetylglucosamine:LPS N-acetylglucosamine transferase
MQLENLSPDEKKQLKEYIESMKAIQEEINTLLSKAGAKTIDETKKPIKFSR